MPQQAKRKKMSSFESVLDELMWFLRSVVIRWLLKDIHQGIIVCIVRSHTDVLANAVVQSVAKAQSSLRV